MQNYLELISGSALLAAMIPALVALCATYKKIKDSEMFQDIFGLYQYFKSKEIIELEKNLERPYLSKEDKAKFKYELQATILQKDLRINEEDLSILRHFKSLIYSDFAVSLYKNCRTLLKFNEQEQKFEQIKPISHENAKKLANIGAFIFFANGLFAYAFMMYMLYFVDINFNNNINAMLVWGFLNFIFMLGIVYIGSRILKIFMRQSNALKLLELEKKKLDTLREENQSKSEED